MFDSNRKYTEKYEEGIVAYDMHIRIYGYLQHGYEPNIEII